MADDAARAHQGVPKFARVPGDTAQRSTVHNRATADTAGTAVEVDHVGEVATGAKNALSECAEAGVVGSDHREPGRFFEHLSEWFVNPAEVRGEANQAVVRSHQSGNGNANTHGTMAEVEFVTQVVDERGTDRDRFSRRRHMVDDGPDAPMHNPAKPNNAHGDGVNLGVDGDAQRTRTRPHDRRGTPHLVARVGIDLDHQLALGELPHEGRDGRPVESCLAGQLRPRDTGGAMHQAQQHRQVMAPNGVVAVTQAASRRRGLKMGCGLSHGHQRPPGILRVRIR